MAMQKWVPRSAARAYSGSVAQSEASFQMINTRNVVGGLNKSGVHGQLYCVVRPSILLTL